jgi:glycogen operon protein
MTKKTGAREANFGPGRPLPLGVSHDCDGINFSLFSRHASAVTLLLFETPEDESPRAIMRLDPVENKTGDIWHLGFASSDATLLYLWQVDGPFDPRAGHRFNGNLALLEPYATALVGTDLGLWSLLYTYISRGRKGSGGP